ncbi:sugar ABC transporter substrate-binding protein [Solibacillus isronensis]|uniref:sugar ABC transporter substrate-binding protein n=1 Tax=Solibacillus isronensis TaxID=412383 RepID=UPI00203A7DD7|nr:sugar ABC transporter substrate-binding protein [Solibacillus isronensis]MCM3722533.1 sugar ABC transporter substrate-binding protein [Solibacillus isronensis]
MKKFNWLLLIVLVVGVLTACGSDETSGEVQGASGSSSDASVAVVLKTLSSPYWKYVEAGAKKAGQELGVDVTVVGPSSEAEVLEQVNMLEDQISQNPSAILLSPTQPDTIINVVKDASRNDIPVLLIDTDADFEGKVTFIGTDNYTAGFEGGTALAAMLTKGDKVALISGALGNPSTDDRIKGAKEALQEAGMEIVAEQPANSDKSEAMSVMENILEKHGDIKAVFSANDDMALGVLRAVQAKKLDVKIFGTDGTEEAVQSILDGGLTGTVAQSPYNMGYEGVSNAIKAINGEKVEERIDSGIEIVTADSAQEFMDFLKSISK